MRCERERNAVILRENKGLNFALIILAVMFPLLFGFVSSTLTDENIGYQIFVFFFFVVYETAAIIAFLTRFDRVVIIDEVGVREERRFLKKRCRKFSWDEIKDWGWSGSYYTVKRGFYIYFSPTRLPTVRNFKKLNRLCLTMAFTNYDQRDIDAEQTVIPYCERFANVPVYRSPKC